MKAFDQGSATMKTPARNGLARSVATAAFGSPGESVRGVGGGAAVPQQDDCHVAATTPVANNAITVSDSATR